MAIDRVREYLKKWDLDGRIQEFEVSSATVDLAAQALGVEGARIAKSLSFMTSDGPILVIAAGDMRIDNPKFKAQFHTKAKMLTADMCAGTIGHSVGGVCPFAVNEGVRVYLDISLRRFETVFPACGSGNSAIELSLKQLEEVAQNCMGWVDVCR